MVWYLEVCGCFCQGLKGWGWGGGGLDCSLFSAALSCHPFFIFLLPAFDYPLQAKEASPGRWANSDLEQLANTKWLTSFKSLLCKDCWSSPRYVWYHCFLAQFIQLCALQHRKHVNTHTAESPCMSKLENKTPSRPSCEEGNGLQELIQHTGDWERLHSTAAAAMQNI